ncbi:MAG: endoribonuclease YicC domain-containing protein, partial [Gemmatimonadota bacterium]
REVDAALVAAETIEEIETAVCERLTGSNRFAFAWFGRIDPASGEIRPSTHAGADDGYLDAVDLAAGGEGSEPSTLAADASVDEGRLAREVAILADRWDIGEEIVRLRSHIDHFRAMLEEESAEPVGKRLSFLVQEMHREANTIGAKANDSEIEHRVVAIKNEIERLREQVENVE